MKKIAIVTEYTWRMSMSIKKNLEKIFKDSVIINLYTIEKLKKGQILEDDLFVVPIKAVIFKLKEYIKEDASVVVMSRTIPQEEVYKIYSIPKGMDVLVVNDTKETTMQIYSLLYNLGIKHVNLIPAEPQNKYPNIKVAITPDEEGYIPSHIKKIINIGQRCLDTSTMIEIADKLGFNNKETRTNIIKYSESIINIDAGIRKNYRELYIKNEEMQTIINLSKDGIVLTDLDGNISLYNKAFKDIFQIDEQINGKKIRDLESLNLSLNIDDDEIKDEIIRYREKYLNLNKIKIQNLGEDIGFYFNIQEITYIKKLEQNLSKKLKESGQIAKYSFDDIITKSTNMKSCITMAQKIATSDFTVIIRGESGTGKEVIAQSIHNESNRKNQPFIAINCAAIPENLLESELFGYEEGTFTGALRGGKPGIFEQAHNGTLFLDEIGDMPVHLQSKLLRVLQERQVSRIGSLKVVDIDVRIIVATHRDIDQMVKEESFRSDLYYRLNVLPIRIPSLRERKEDIEFILMEELKNRNKNFIIEDQIRKKIINYSWPGNVRELINFVSYICLMNKGKVLESENLPLYINEIEDEEEIKELELIRKDSDEKKVREVMEAIRVCESMKISSGRLQISKILEEKGFQISEGEVRSILDFMKNLGLINSFSGRRGSKLTKKGLDVLNWLKKPKNRFE